MMTNPCQRESCELRPHCERLRKHCACCPRRRLGVGPWWELQEVLLHNPMCAFAGKSVPAAELLETQSPGSRPAAPLPPGPLPPPRPQLTPHGSPCHQPPHPPLPSARRAFPGGMRAHTLEPRSQTGSLWFSKSTSNNSLLRGSFSSP